MNFPVPTSIWKTNSWKQPRNARRNVPSEKGKPTKSNKECATSPLPIIEIITATRSFENAQRLLKWPTTSTKFFLQRWPNLRNSKWFQFPTSNYNKNFGTSNHSYSSSYFHPKKSIHSNKFSSSPRSSHLINSSPRSKDPTTLEQNISSTH